jgi:hypothetical protein
MRALSRQSIHNTGEVVPVVVPGYLVLGNIFSRLPAPLVACLAAMSGFYLGGCAAMFAEWHKFNLNGMRRPVVPRKNATITGQTHRVRGTRKDRR